MFLNAVFIILAINVTLLCQAMPRKNQMPYACAGKEYCFEQHPLYPANDINTLLRIKGGWFKTDDIHIGDRGGSIDTNESPCKYNATYKKIYEIIDESDKLRFVVQSNKTFEQVVRVEECLTPGRIWNAPDFFDKNELHKTVVSCEQKRIDYKFLVMSLDGTGFDWVKVKNGLPVCCSCRIH